jgi:hypothetical protein
MGFDKDSGETPVVQPAKKTTQVNFIIVGAVVVFLLFGVVGMLWVNHASPTHGGNLQPNEQRADAPK